MIIREADRDDLPALLALMRQDVIREVDESDLDVDDYLRAFDESLGFTPSHIEMKLYLGGAR